MCEALAQSPYTETGSGDARSRNLRVIYRTALLGGTVRVGQQLYKMNLVILLASLLIV